MLLSLRLCLIEGSELDGQHGAAEPPQGHGREHSRLSPAHAALPRVLSGPQQWAHCGAAFKKNTLKKKILIMKYLFG